MHMLAAARECLVARDGTSLLFDRTDYETTLGTAARRVSEQMQYRCGLDTDTIAAVLEEALTMLREHYRSADTLGIGATTVPEIFICLASDFWSDPDTDDSTCTRMSTAAMRTPVPAPTQLAPAAFAELALHAGAASGWEKLTDDQHNEVLDADGARGGSRWHEVQADLDVLPHEGLGLTRNAEHLTPHVVSDADDSEDVPPIDADTVAMALGAPEGLELVLREIIDGSLYETCIPADLASAPTRTTVKINDYRNEASTDVLLHLLAAGDADGGRPAALPPGNDEYALMGGSRNTQRRAERLANSAKLALQAHVLLYRSGGRARAAGTAARDGGESMSAQPVPQLLMELCLASGFAWRWIQRVADCWSDDAARSKTISTKVHLLAGAVTDGVHGCLTNVLGDEVLGSEAVAAIADTVSGAADKISAGHIRQLQHRYGLPRGHLSR